MSKVLFLDAYNLIHRARSGFTRGEYPVIYNFFRGIRPLIEKFNPDKVYFVLEGIPKFRQSLSEGEYKKGRKNPGSSFHRQKAAIINLVIECMPFETVRHPDLECDDTIATLTRVHASKEDECVIVSSDSDFIQLLNYFDKVKLYNPVKKEFIDKPDYDYVMWKALRGDPTDNIKGLPGVGDKTADKLIANKSLLEERLAIGNNLNIFEKNVNLIRLVDFSNDLNMLECIQGNTDFEKLKTSFRDMEFTSMIKEKSWNKFIDTFEGL
jgi:DNA polymerase-1